MTSSDATDSQWFIETVSPWSVKATIERLLRTIEMKGLKCFAMIDHGAEARRVGLELSDTKVIIFGGPANGTPIMVAWPHAALDLPMRILVWQDGAEVKVGHTATWEFGRRFGIGTELLAELAGIDAIVRSAVSAQEQ